MVSLVVVLDVVAPAATLFVVNKFYRGGWLLGAIIGLTVEAVRILTAKAIIRNPYDMDDALAFFANFRLVKIPILVGVGVIVGSAAQKVASYGDKQESLQLNLSPGTGDPSNPKHTDQLEHGGPEIPEI